MIWKRILILVSALALFTSSAWGAYNAEFVYNYAQAGNHYTFTVNVTNTSSSPDLAHLDYFRIIFDADPVFDSYANLAWNNGKGWLTLEDQPLPGFGGSPGVVHADDSIFGTAGGGIAAGSSVYGFQFSFDYTGPVAPDQQLMTWHAEYGTNDAGNGIPIGDPQNPDYWIMGSADGQLKYGGGGPTPPIPEPGTVLLVGAGLAGLIYWRKRQ